MLKTSCINLFLTKRIINNIENIARNTSLETFENFNILRFNNDVYMLKEFISYVYKSHKKN